MKVRYTLEALDELRSVLDYIGDTSPRGADRVRKRILAQTRNLSDWPHSGAETGRGDLRRIAATPYPYVVHYRVLDNEVVIVAVRHTARRPLA